MKTKVYKFKKKMTKVLIIGNNSFIGSNLFSFLKKDFFVKKLSFSSFKEKNTNFLKKYTHVINCSINPNYAKSKYKSKFDNDLIIANKIKNFKIKYIFLSSRKIYKPKLNIKETDTPYPSCSYSKNKLITEKKLSSILNNKVLIFRISNVIGLPIKNNKRKVHLIFVDHFFESVNRGIVFDNNNNFKDFISIKMLSKIIFFSIKKDISGIYNCSIGKKIYLNKIVGWLNYYNKNKCKIVKIKKNLRNKDNFTLNNNKIMKIMSFKYSINDLEKYCKGISKIYFEKKI